MSGRVPIEDRRGRNQRRGCLCLGTFPVDSDRWHHDLAPFEIDGDEVVFGDADAADIMLVGFEVLFDELSK